MLQHTLRALGISERRVRLVWASAAEAAHLAEAIDEMVEDLRTLGPLHWSTNWSEGDGHLDDVEKILLEHQAAMEVGR
jgi:hypothetical protein